MTSRIPGFYSLSIEERRRLAERALGLEAGALETSLASGGLSVLTADKTIENVIGTYAMPLGLALNLTMNGRDHLVPMVVEEPSVIAAASNAAKIVRQGSGFLAEADDPIMIAQIQLDRVPDIASARHAILEHRDELLAMADQAVPGLVSRGGGARDVEVRDLGDGWLVVHVHVDCCDAMGANLVNTVAERLAPGVEELTGGRVGLRILSNLSDRRMVRVRCEIPLSCLKGDDMRPDEVRDGIVRASEFAARDPYRAATHNKGIMNGVDPVVIATGNDWRAVEAGAHAWAARTGKYGPLATWHVGDRGALEGRLEMPLALGIVGGTLRVHEAARMALRIAGIESAEELSMLAASAGLASNFAALRALATVGIQRGHMALHARSVAMAAGARDEWVELVAHEIHASGEVTIEAARRTLARVHQSREVQAAE